MDAIVVDKSAQEPLPAYRRKMSRFVKKHPAAGWGYDPFAGFADLLPSIEIADGPGPGLASIIEIIAHGSPVYIHEIGETTVAPFAAALVAKFPALTEVYLTGCNTGLSEGGYCIAEELARALEGVTVHGAAGYVTKGAAASGDAETHRVGDGPAVAHSRDDVHPTCWNHFHFRPSGPTRVAARADMKPTPQLPEAVLRDTIVDALRVAQSHEPPRLLTGPDVRGVIQLPDGPFSFELLARGTILRNAISRETWNFPRGPELLDEQFRAPR